MKSKSVSKKKAVSDEQVGELLVDLFDRYQDTFERFQWPDEVMRWHELVFCLLSSVENRFGPDTNSASAMRVLTELELLDVSLLAKKAENTRRQLIMVLEQLDFSSEQAEKAVKAIFELAAFLEKKYQGKVQLLLRPLGTEMAEKVLRELPLDSTLGKPKAGLVVAHWLQNVLNLPVPVPSPGLNAFLEETGAKSAQVVAVADEQNVNLALVDDILNSWLNDRPPEA